MAHQLRQPRCMSHTKRDNFNSSAFSFCKPSCPRIRQWQIWPPENLKGLLEKAIGEFSASGETPFLEPPAPWISMNSRDENGSRDVPGMSILCRVALDENNWCGLLQWCVFFGIFWMGRLWCPNPADPKIHLCPLWCYAKWPSGVPNNAQHIIANLERFVVEPPHWKWYKPIGITHPHETTIQFTYPTYWRCSHLCWTYFRHLQTRI